jgi:serine protease Do
MERMRNLFPFRRQSCAFLALVAGVLLWRTPPLFAIDIFGPSKSEEASPAPAGRTGQLPSLSETAKNASPAVVNISTTQKVERRRRMPPFPMPGPGPGPGPGPNPFGGDDPFEEFFRRFFGDRPPPGQQRSLGSGFIISEDGYIITNHHVVGDADKITVRLSDKEEYDAKVVGSDDKTDIAVVKINVKHSLHAIPLGSSADLQVGDWVMAIGNPFGLDQTVTAGIVSAKGRVIGAGPYDDFIQTDASINPGNSGGPLLNLKGEVVGINSAIFSQSGGNIGIGFAIPVDLAKSIVAQLKDKGKVTRGWLGVSIQSITPELAKSFGLKEPSGALVAEVTKDSPAEKAGFERGDIITAFNSSPIKDSHELPALVARTPVGDKAQVTILRGGKEKTLAVKLGELTEQQAKAESEEGSGESWGMTVASLSSEAARRFQLERNKKGVVVTEVDPGSSAELAGIQPGDVIEEVNRQSIESVEDFNKAMADAKDKETLLLLARRGNFTSFFALRKIG